MSKMKNNLVLSCTGLKVSLNELEIVKGVNLDVFEGEVHAIMGPNGSGKSTLATALAGHPGYILDGEVSLDGKNLLELGPDERSKAGLFLGFQYPVAVPGVTVASFLRAALGARSKEPLSVFEYTKLLHETLDYLEIPKDFAKRYLNDGFSGGEKKRLEILQLLLLKPKIALLDEIDSGLDIDALKVVSKGINKVKGQGTSIVLITHYQRILDYVKPDLVHVFVDGKIVKTGGPEQALLLEEHGYEEFETKAELVGGGM